MLCLAIFMLLQSSLTYTSVTFPHVTYFWKTTEEIDKVYDYWNHGPINIPGLQDIFTVTTKVSDSFPRWPTISTEAIKHATPKTVTPITTTTTLVEFPETVSLPTDKSKTIEKTKEMDKTAAKTEPIATTTTITTQHIPPTILQSESEEDGTTDAFSVFLRKLFRSLLVKNFPELPALVEPFVTYLEELANDQLKLFFVGDVIIPFVKKVTLDIRKMIKSSPDVLRAKVYQVYTALTNRSTALDTDVLGLLNVLDDTFDEAEEEFMQRTLHDVKRFPNSNKTGKEIAHDFLDNIILAAVKRISGTSKVETLLLMLTDMIEKRKSDVRRNLKKIFRALQANDKASSYVDDISRPVHRLNILSSNISSYGTHSRVKKSVNNWRNKNTKLYTQSIYQAIRNNLEDISHLMDKVVMPSSSEINEYELSVHSESEDKVRSAPEQTNNIQFRINKESKSPESEYSDSEELHKMGNKTIPKYPGRQNDPSNIFKHLIERNSKAQSGYDDVGLGERKKTKEDETKKKTILVPQLSLLTKLIKDNVLYFDDSKNTRKNVASRTTYWKNNKKKAITKPMTLNPGDGMMSNYINNAIPRKQNFTTKLSLSYLTNTYPSRNKSKLVSVSTTEKTKIFNKKAVYANVAKHLESTQLYTGKPVTKMKHTEDNNETEISRNTKKYDTKDNIKTSVEQNSVNITENDYSDIEYLSFEGETLKESTDSISDTDYSSEDTGDLFQENQEYIDETIPSPLRHSQGRSKHQKHRHRHRHKKRKHEHGHSKRKYESLKRKYQRLKDILAARKVTMDHSRPEEMKNHIDINMKQAGMNESGSKVYQKSSAEKPAAENNPFEITTLSEKENLEFNGINLFLEDYDTKAKISEESYTIRNGIFRKAFPLNTALVFEANDSSDAEKEINENIHDTIRHMDFDNNNVSRRYHDDDTSTVRILESPETDVEAVLKSNIYKAVKKMLKK